MILGSGIGVVGPLWRITTSACRRRVADHATPFDLPRQSLKWTTFPSTITTNSHPNVAPLADQPRSASETAAASISDRPTPPHHTGGDARSYGRAVRRCLPPPPRAGIDQKAAARPGCSTRLEFEHPVVGGCGDVDAPGGVCRHRPGLEQTRRRQPDPGARPGWQFEHPVVGGSEEPRRSLAPRMRIRRTANMGFCPAARPTAPRSCYARGMPAHLWNGSPDRPLQQLQLGLPPLQTYENHHRGNPQRQENDHSAV